MGRSHYGEVCIRIRICGINRCKELNNGVLHRENFVGTNTEEAEKKEESPSTRKREQAREMRDLIQQKCMLQNSQSGR